MRVLSLLALALLWATSLHAQTLTPGLWHYRIVTDLSALPRTQHDNFQPVQFERCLSEADIISGQALHLQTTAKSAARCETLDYEAKAGAVRYRFQCDQGQSLVGSASGDYRSKQFTVKLISEPRPAFPGIPALHQTLHGRYLGPCKL